MLKEFKDFIMTGNVVEFAVAVIMAGVIGAVVTGFVEDIIMPIVGHFSVKMEHLAEDLRSVMVSGSTPSLTC